MNDLFGNEIVEPWPVAQGKLNHFSGRRSTVANGYARRPGSGPANETCGTCQHAVKNHPKYWKCAVIRFRWTRGPGTDIKLKSPACEMWAKKL